MTSTGTPAGHLATPRQDRVSEAAEPVYLTVRDVARRCGVSANLLYSEVAAGRFPPARRIGHRIVVPLAALQRWEAGE